MNIPAKDPPSLRDAVDAYLDTMRRIEPDIAAIDAAAYYASAAISLRRMADALEATAATARASLEISTQIRDSMLRQEERWARLVGPQQPPAPYPTKPGEPT